MAVGKTFTSEADPTADGLALTYVVPATRCDLNCGYCFIRHRREAERPSLTPRDYVSFLDSVAEAYPVRVSGLQGYEPLLEESWAYTAAILMRSADLSIPTSMVTNGTHLARRATDLARLGLKDITVSVDSSIPAAHDKLRGSSGAFERTFAGIRAALSEETFRSRLVVASVLLPGKRHLLDGMPRLLADNGVKYFGVTPFIKVPRSGFGRMIQEHGSLMDDLERLRVASEESGVQFVVDDELARFRHVFDGANKFMIHSLSRPGRLIRLTPSGACSIGLDVLRQVSEVTPRWQPRVESGASFLSRLNLEAPPLWPEPTLCVAA